MESQNVLNQRVKDVRKFLDLNQEQVADATNIKRSSISKIENGLQDVPNELLLFYSESCGISAEWLLTGKGPMQKEGKQNNTNTLTGNNNSGNQWSGGNMSYNSSGECEQKLAIAQTEIEGLKREVDLYKKMIALLENK